MAGFLQVSFCHSPARRCSTEETVQLPVSSVTSESTSTEFTFTPGMAASDQTRSASSKTEPQVMSFDDVYRSANPWWEEMPPTALVLGHIAVVPHGIAFWDVRTWLPLCQDAAGSGVPGSGGLRPTRLVVRPGAPGRPIPGMAT